MSQRVPVIAASSRSTSARVSTTGSRGGRLGRCTPSSHASSRPSTSRYRNRIAESAWFCVAAATWRSAARWLRKAVTSASPIASGCRLPLKKMKRLIQCTYASSVRRL